jgi:hypothetical protein
LASGVNSGRNGIDLERRPDMLAIPVMLIGLSLNFIGVSPIRALVFAAVFNAAPRPTQCGGRSSADNIVF